MGSMQRFLDRFGPSSEAESVWLQNLFTFIHKHLRTPGGPAHSAAGGPAHPAAADQPGAGASCDQGVCELSVCVVEKIQERSCLRSSRPVSYRPLCVSELLAQQHLACVSNLSWSTNQHRAWAREAELSLAGQRSLPRVNLLLIGWLRAGRGGEWRLEDGSGSVRCELTSPSPQWMNRLVFLPHWNYIPHDALGRGQDRGHLELIGSPDLLGPRAELGLATGPGGAGPEEGAGPDGALSVREAAGVLRTRVRGQRVSVWGRVGSVRPLLEVSGSCFFFFCLEDQQQTVPVLVKGSRLWWAQCVCVGVSVCVTALRVCVLRRWRGNGVLCVTDRSEMHTGYTHSEATHTQGHTHPEDPEPLPLSTPGPAHSDQLLMGLEEAEPEELPVQSGGRIKHSSVISYQGTVTEVVNEGAGLYLLDRKVGLCLAFQPPARRKLRPGDQVELHQVHFLYRPSPDFPPSMLCCCLGSSLRVSAFSRVGGASKESCCPGDGVLPLLLLQSNRGVDQYLWTCSLACQLAHSLVPAEPLHPPLHPPLPHCVCLLSWKLSEMLWTQRGRGQRDIYSEMLDRPHRCPLDQYQVDPSVPQLLSVSDVLQSLQSSSLLPPGVLSSSQVNSGLSWSYRTLTSDPRRGDSLRPRPLLLVGVLQLPSERSEFTQSLELRDATASVSCIVTETTEEEDGGQRSVFNTAWIGSLVCVRSFTMVTERFLQSDFPSCRHLDQNCSMSNRTCRVYLQFSLDHLVILSPSVAMATHLRIGGVEPGSDDQQRNHREEEEDDDDEGSCLKKRRCDEELSSVAMVTAPEGGASQPCVSMVIRVESKGGVAWRNAVIGGSCEGAGLQLGFSATALLIGPVVRWGRDPKNQPMMEKEVNPEREEKVLLQFSGVSSRWFPLLQPGSVYRLTAPNTQDPSVLIGCSVAGQKGVELHADSSLQVRPDWRFHTLTRPLLLPHTWTQAPPPSTVSQVLDCRSEVVTFQGRVTERVSLMDRREQASGVRLTVCDQSGRSLCVYLDLTHTPYPPGLLPGNQVLLSGFLRRISRSGSVYCSPSPVSCITVTSLGDCSRLAPPPAPSMHLAHWASSRTVEAQVKGHLVCVLHLQLQWSCSHRGGEYEQVCSSPCGSATFQATARLVFDDGTAEAHVWLSGRPVQTVLGLADSQWAGLQRAVRVRGHIHVFPGGRSLRTDGDTEDVLLHFLLSLCSGDVIGQQVILTCRKRTNQSPAEVRRFSRGDRDFLTRRLRPLQLTCSHLELQGDS
ncbi:CST complex subunit CTC1 isoform X2 [Poecilia formosa]|uniref:CST complex subunit CTC1 isoform X2 n=1 Tax=Poecilia formosa TaxID=48698 RepID=UPI0007B8CD98|nr:PREDICTED: CST complex subunit CTC1 isoform X2 [Poecilia formosa]